jgi:plastocyanin
MLSKWLSLVSGVPGALLLLSCGGGSSTSPYGGGGTGGTPPASCASSGASATITATGSFTFSPSTATIAAGQKVCWVNNTGIGHTVSSGPAQTTSSDDGRFTGGSLPNAGILVVTFPVAGSYPFHCNIHLPPTYNMTGTITVQ